MKLMRTECFPAGCDQYSREDHQRPTEVCKRTARTARLTEKQNQKPGGEGREKIKRHKKHLD